MKVDVETLEGTKRRVSVEVPSEMVNQELLKIYDTIRKEARIPGFRPGRAPLKLLKARFKDHVRQEALQQLVPQAYESAFKEHDLHPLAMPELETKLDELTVEEDNPLTVIFTVDVRPDFTLPSYSEIEIDKQAVNVAPEAVDNVISRLREQRAEYPTIEEERPTQAGDFLIVDWVVSEADQELDKQEDFRIKLDDDELFTELVQGLTGVAIGSEHDIYVTFPEDFPEPKLAGKSVVFHVTIKQICKQVLPELDDTFAADLDCDSLEQLKGRTWNQLIEAEKAHKYQRQVSEILAQLREKTDISVPEFYVEEQVQRLKEQYRKEWRRQNRPLDGLESEEMQEALRKESVTGIQNSWLLAKIIAQEEIGAEEWEIDREIRNMARQRNQDADTYRQMLETAGRLEQLQESVIEAKAFDFLIENASAKEPLIIVG